jgi:hypothetical protein
MSDFSFNNDSNIELDIDIENILESLDNNSEKSDINNFTKKLENELINYNKNNTIKEKINISSDQKIDSNEYNLYNLINNNISKDIFVYTLIFIIINLMFINKFDYKYLYLVIKIFLFILFLLIIKKNNLLKT